LDGLFDGDAEFTLGFAALLGGERIEECWIGGVDEAEVAAVVAGPPGVGN
jgi:hypothetical protein